MSAGTLVVGAGTAAILRQQTDGYIISQAAAKISEPFAPLPLLNKHVVKREQLEVIKKRLCSPWDPRTTIVAGQYMTGKSTLMDSALSGVNGVVRVNVDTNEWKADMYRKVGVKDSGQLEMALQKATEALGGKPPLLYLDVPRNSTASMKEISTFCKLFVTDLKVARVVVVASQLTTALVFDAGGKERQYDIWVGPMTEAEAQELLSKNFPQVLSKDDMGRIIEQVGTNPGALDGVMQHITEEGMSVNQALEVRYRRCAGEVHALLAVRIPDDEGNLQDVGKRIVRALLESGGKETEAAGVAHGRWLVDKGISVKKVAADLKHRDAFGISYNTKKECWHFASPMHKKVAQET